MPRRSSRGGRHAHTQLKFLRDEPGLWNPSFTQPSRSSPNSSPIWIAAKQREAERRIGAGRIMGTKDPYLLAIGASLIAVEQADKDKAVLERHRFRMEFESFRDIVRQRETKPWSTPSPTEATTMRPQGLRPGVQRLPHTSRASCTTRRSFASCCAKLRPAPFRWLANPHCGETQRFSSGT